MSFNGAGRYWIPGNPPEWEQHYCICPRKINGRWYWLEYVHRKFVLSPGGGFWRFGDDFDRLKDG